MCASGNNQPNVKIQTKVKKSSPFLYYILENGFLEISRNNFAFMLDRKNMRDLYKFLSGVYRD